MRNWKISDQNVAGLEKRQDRAKTVGPFELSITATRDGHSPPPLITFGVGIYLNDGECSPAARCGDQNWRRLRMDEHSRMNVA